MSKLLTITEVLAQAQKEHFEKTGGNYICPLPKDVKP